MINNNNVRKIIFFKQHNLNNYQIKICKNDQKNFNKEINTYAIIILVQKAFKILMNQNNILKLIIKIHILIIFANFINNNKLLKKI